VAVGIAAVGWLSLDRDPALRTHDFGTDPGPALVPRLLLVALAIGGAALMVHGGFGLTRRGPRAPMAAEGARRFLWPTLFVASLLVYQRALPLAGYPAATFAFCAAWILVLTRREGWLTVRSAGVGVGAAVVITAAIYHVFKGFVRVPLP